MKCKLNKKAFTLIELLVVVAIIGILATVVVVNMSGAQNKARDAKVKADLGTVQKAASLYYLEKGNYIDLACSQASAIACDSADFTSSTDVNIKTIGNAAKDIKTVVSDGLTINATSSTYETFAKLPSTLSGNSVQTYEISSEAGTRTLGPELQINSDFENGLTGWALYDATNNVGLGFTGVVTADSSAHSGVKSVKLSRGLTSAGVPPLIGQYLIGGIAPGRTYSVSLWSRGDGTNPPSYQVTVWPGGSNLINRTATGNTSTSYAWTSFAFTVPAGSLNSARLYMTTANVNNASAWFDDISIKEVLK